MTKPVGIGTSVAMAIMNSHEQFNLDNQTESYDLQNKPSFVIHLDVSVYDALFKSAT